MLAVSEHYTLPSRPDTPICYPTHCPTALVQKKLYDKRNDKYKGKYSTPSYCTCSTIDQQCYQMWQNGFSRRPVYGESVWWCLSLSLSLSLYFYVLYLRLQCVMWFGQTISCGRSFQSALSAFNTIRLTDDRSPLNFQQRLSTGFLRVCHPISNYISTHFKLLHFNERK